jgi:hypothetical protein
MNLVVLDYDRDVNVQSLRQGPIAYLEPVSEALEAGLFRDLLSRQILERLAVYCQQRFALLSLPEFAEILLSLPAPARQQLLPKMRQLRRDLYRLLENARAP